MGREGGEAKPKLGWDIKGNILGGLEGGSEIGQSLAWEEVMVSIVVSRWGEGVLAMFKHGLGIGRGEVAWLSVEIEEDGVRLPMSQGMDGGLVNTGDEEGGGASGAEAVDFDAFRRNVCEVKDGSGGTAEFSGDIVGSDIVGSAVGVKVAIQGSVGRGVVCP